MDILLHVHFGHIDETVTVRADATVEELKLAILSHAGLQLRSGNMFALRVSRGASAGATLADGTEPHALCEGDTVDVVPTACADAAASLLEEGLPVTGERLCVAAGCGDAALCARYLAAGVSPDSADGAKGGCTALAWAVRGGDLATISLLLDAGADANLATGTGWRPLLLAALEGRAAAAKLLLHGGARAEEGYVDGRTALCFAAVNGHLDVVVLMLKEGGADVDVRSGGGFTPLIRAARNGHCSTVRCLLDKGARADAECHDGRSALVFCALAKDTETASLLVRYGAVLEPESHYGTEWLKWAAKRGLREPGDPKWEDNAAWAALEYARRGGGGGGGTVLPRRRCVSRDADGAHRRVARAAAAPGVERDSQRCTMA
eukprot:Rhum_TRINITY_DN15024_c13_g2::Rhum_TRINITY_DN15024_c13_g2_i1::g.133865::m.133865